MKTDKLRSDSPDNSTLLDLADFSFPSPSSEPNYRICSKCVMDTTDPDISFNEQDVCSHCQHFEMTQAEFLFEDERQGLEKLHLIVERIKAEGKGKKYDCLVGMSGGVDSSFVAYQVKKLGLRPLAIHFDCGWNSEIAVRNISNIVKKLDIDLYTHVVDWEEMRDLQLSFLKASVPNADTPTDHAFLGATYKVADKLGIKYIMSGGNHATESVLPKAWGYTTRDVTHIKGVQKKFGKLKLKKYPLLGILPELFYYRLFRGIKTIRLLNFTNYVKADAMKILQEELGWEYYGGKHYESVFTRFFQAYYLPMKFGFDKRKAHLSSLILAGQMTREEALAELEQETYPKERLINDIEFVVKKLGVTFEEFKEIMLDKPKSHLDYPNNLRFLNFRNSIGAFRRSFIGSSKGYS